MTDITPYSFTPEEKIAIQIALVDLLFILEERLKSYDGTNRPSNHTRGLMESTKSALNKVNQ